MLDKLYRRRQSTVLHGFRNWRNLPNALDAITGAAKMIHFLGGMQSVTATYLVWSRYKTASLPDWEWVNDLPDGVSQVAHWVIKRISK